MMRENVNKNDDCGIYILLLTTLVILILALKRFSFSVFSFNIPIGFLLIPGVYFLLNTIYKRYDLNKAIVAIAVSGVISIGFHSVVSYFMDKNLIFTNLCGDFCGYVVSQFVHLLLYEYYCRRSKRDFLPIFLTYFIGTMVYLIFYTLIYLYIVLSDGFLFASLILVVIEFIICLLFSYLDVKIK